MGLLALLIVVVVGYVLIKQHNTRTRRKRLVAKYGDAELVDLIMAKRIRQGMTAEQLTDSWGRPVDVDEKVYKTKTKYTFKYGKTGRNRFRERVFVENNVVVGWQERG